MSQVPIPTLDQEMILQEHGYRVIAGVDEAGRGSIFGPVCVGMAVLPLDDPATLVTALSEVRDSKQISRPKVYRLAQVVKEEALAWGVGIGTAQEVDTVGIMGAIRLAATRALEQLETTFSVQVDFLLTDSTLPCPTHFPTDQRLAIVKGDALCLSIACGAILAKQAHDELVREIAAQYSPEYQLNKNVGYGTQAHRDAIGRLGYTDQHRRTFKLKSLLTPR